MTYEFSRKPRLDGRINVWRRASDFHPWELIEVVDEPHEAWEFIAAERAKDRARAMGEAA